MVIVAVVSVFLLDRVYGEVVRAAGGNKNQAWKEV